MAINKKLIHFKTRAAFEAQLNNILDTSIVFIQDANLIWTHGTYYCLPSDEVVISNGVEPDNDQDLWIDTSYNNPNPDVSNDSVPPTVKFLLKKITDLYSEINTLKTELEEIKKMIESGEIKPSTPTSGTIFITESGEYLTTESGDYFGME